MKHAKNKYKKENIWTCDTHSAEGGNRTNSEAVQAETAAVTIEEITNTVEDLE